MSDRMTHALMLLQQCAYARVLCEFHRRQAPRGDGEGLVPATTDALVVSVRRLKACDQRWEGMRRVLGTDDLARVRVARALYLQSMRRSAPARLGPWSDCCGVDRMPPSHLLEWVSYDLESMELADLEASMGPEEAALYACAMDRPA